MKHAARVAMACDGMKDFRCVRRRKTPWVGFRRHASNFQHPFAGKRLALYRTDFFQDPSFSEVTAISTSALEALAAS